MLRLLLPILGLFAALLGIAWWTDKPLPKADFTFINRGDVSTLDPAIASWRQDLRVLRMIGEGLTRTNIFRAGSNPTPAGAESWEVSPDGRTYTFRLRAGARWSDGSPVTSRDYVFAWRRAMCPELAGDYIKLFTLIEGGAEFIAWRTAALGDFAATTPPDDRAQAAAALWEQTLRRFEELVRVRAVDDATLVVRLVRPTPYFLDLLGFPAFFPLPEHVVSAYERIDEASAAIKPSPEWAKPPTLVGNGPFVLEQWRFKRDMFFRRSATYWGKDEVNIRTVSIPTVNDPNASVLALTSGGVDYVTDVVPDYRVRMWRQKQEYLERHARTIADARARGITDPLTIDRLLPPDPRLSMHVFPAFGTYFYNFNCAPALADGRPNVFADARLRKAFALCVDKEAITRDIRRMGEPVAATFIPANALPGYPTPDGLSFDPASAQRLFAQAFPAGPSAFPAVEILVNKDAGHDLIAQSVAKDWQKHLGVQVRLRIQEVKTFRESLKKGDYMVSRAAWFGDYFDPTTFLDLNRTGDGNNDRQYANPAYDALLDRAAGETDPRSRMELLSQAERMLVEEELPLIPLFQYVNMYLYDPHKVAGLSPHPRGEDQIWRVDILGDGIGADAPGVYEGFGP